MNSYAFCGRHASVALSHLIVTANANAINSFSAPFQMRLVGKASGFRCHCGRKAQFYVWQISSAHLQNLANEDAKRKGE